MGNKDRFDFGGIPHVKVGLSANLGSASEVFGSNSCVTRTKSTIIE